LYELPEKLRFSGYESELRAAESAVSAALRAGFLWDLLDGGRCRSVGGGCAGSDRMSSALANASR